MYMNWKNIELANWFINKAVSEGKPLTQMQLQKLIYFAHALSLAARDKPLVHGQFEAWKYGPVLSDLYFFTQHYGPDPIKDRIAVPSSKSILQLFYPTVKSDDVKEILQNTWNTYSKFTAFELSLISHEPKSPWDVYFDEKKNNLIPDQVIAEFYKKRLRNV